MLKVYGAQFYEIIRVVPFHDYFTHHCVLNSEEAQGRTISLTVSLRDVRVRAMTNITKMCSP